MTENMEFCKGCCRKPCTYSSEYIEECPCGICLIKGVCRRACDDFIDFVGGKQNLIFENLIFENPHPTNQ